MNHDLFDAMFRMEQHHWWSQARVKIVRNLLSRYVVRPPAPQKPRLADLGCGCGFMLTQLAGEYDAVGMDAFDEAIAYCSQRGIAAQKGFLPGPVPFEENQFDAAIFTDVLEHLDDDANSVATATRLLKPGGVIVATSPAYQWLWTSRDDFYQHKRRYSHGNFTDLFRRAGLGVLVSSYANTILFPLALTERLARKLRPLKQEQTDLSILPAPINATMRELFAVERHALGRVRLPFGLSVVCVARKG